ncbi:hypothetical protein SAMN05421688_2555 [Poseidonocella pacifica]|uniref:Dihydroxy-acid dehydratase n=1 Tax=Poseidonocella pacifica TaxID=871651 RepID=A0A1I0XXK8_9RHOB|nr:hypothetical protein [Poseidonocella pacifica]SFB05030.1 hypothetical protein SAMN05421688_2555 [Poseidonocella pacifica]
MGRAIRIAALGAVMLAGCVPAGGPVTQSMSFAGGGVVIAPPLGYCIDREATRRGDGMAFALVASCSRLSDGAEPGPARPLVLTATVDLSPTTAGEVDLTVLTTALQPFGPSEARAEGDMALVRLSKGGQKIVPDGASAHWRAGLNVNGHGVLIGVFGPKGSAVGDAAGARLARSFAESIRKASSAK